MVTARLEPEAEVRGQAGAALFSLAGWFQGCEIGSPPARVLNAERTTKSVDVARNREEPSAKAKFAPPVCMLPQALSRLAESAATWQVKLIGTQLLPPLSPIPLFVPLVTPQPPQSVRFQGI